MKTRIEVVLLFHECISFTLKSMNSEPPVEIENLRSALEAAEAGAEILRQHLLACETKRSN